MNSTTASKLRFRTTTAICVVLTTAVVGAAYASEFGHSSWDKRSHATSNEQSGKADNSVKLEVNAKKEAADKVKTASPIKHVIVLIGENRGLDHTFGVYKPKGKKETISNLLSKGIVNEDGSPGPNYVDAQQFSVAAQSSYYVGAPAIAKSPYNAANVMPQPNTSGTPTAQSDTGAPFKTIAEASVEKDMDPASLDILTASQWTADRRSRHPRSRCRIADRPVPDAGPEPQRR